jgi:hypothetical protein
MTPGKEGTAQKRRKVYMKGWNWKEVWPMPKRLHTGFRLISTAVHKSKNTSLQKPATTLKPALTGI